MTKQFFDPPDKEDMSFWNKNPITMLSPKKSDFQNALEWLEAESSGSEGFITPEIETIRTLLKEAIEGTQEK